MAKNSTIELRHAHLFCGLGGGAAGFNDALPIVGNLHGRWRCIGGIDVDPAGIADFQQLTGKPGTVLDLFDLEQYFAFWGHMPPAGWRESTPASIHHAFGHEVPDTMFLSAPCKGFSGLLSQTKSLTDKYQALNRLTLRGVWLTLEAYKDDPIPIILFENVPRIATRGRHLLDQITSLLRAYGYAVAETTHDCGEIGDLAQSRKRFLLVARHIEKVPPFLYVPDKHPLRAVGEVLGKMPLPGDECAGPMHRVPRLNWKTWVRLAFVEAGSDWRSLNKLAVENGTLRDYLIVPEARHSGMLGVNTWEEHAGTVTSRGLPNNGNFAVADPRHSGPAKHANEYRIVAWDKNAKAVTSAHGSGQAVADPRPEWEGRHSLLHVAGFNSSSRTITAGGKGVQGGHLSVADPRPGMSGRTKGDHYWSGGHYGVVPWSGTSYAVSASAGIDNGSWSIADPRPMPAPTDKLVARITALDGTWHRPFTTLELAALQSLLDPEDAWVTWKLHGESDQAWRERIGNAVPRKAAKAIAEVIGETLLLARTGETFLLSSRPVWVRPVALALAVQGV